MLSSTPCRDIGLKGPDLIVRFWDRKISIRDLTIEKKGLDLNSFIFEEIKKILSSAAISLKILQYLIH